MNSEFDNISLHLVDSTFRIAIWPWLVQIYRWHHSDLANLYFAT